MSQFAVGHPTVVDSEQQRNNDDLLTAINQIAQFIDFGDGAPSHSPAGPALYFNRTGGVGTSVYGWDGTSWTALV